MGIDPRSATEETRSGAHTFAACAVNRTAFHEQHPWLFRWPPLLFTAFWVVDTARWGPHRWWSLTIFYALFLLAFLRVFSRSERHPRLWLAALFIMGYAYVPFNENVAGEFVFPVVMSVFFLRQAKLGVALRWFALIEAASALGMYTEFRLTGEHMRTVENVVFYMLAIGFMNFAYSRHILASEQLARANQEIEHLAQTAERERIARDLHDLLGHTLTVIALKSDAANRLFSLDPERAHREIAEVETTARQALAEVREAVAGYRTVGFAAEIHQARRALASAGVQLTTQVEGVPLSDEETSVLCLALREAVTNVIRHSGATICTLVLQRDGDRVRMQIEDNGKGMTGWEGNGLRGMRERLRGGELSWSNVPGGGTLLVAELPLSTRPRPRSETELSVSSTPRSALLPTTSTETVRV